MQTLLSKVQYKNFETGEFTDAAFRDYSQTLALIEAFPWNAQREKLAVSLTNPSITIEGPDQDFLKLALFYNQKYVLHYCDKASNIFTKSFTSLPDAFPFIENLFSAGTFNTAGFKKDNIRGRKNRPHFVSGNFTYTVTPQSAQSFLFKTSGWSFLISLFMVIAAVTNQFKGFNVPVFFLFLLILFLTGGGVNLLLFRNFCRHAKNKVLKMTRGNDTFYFGEQDHLIQYDKKDIRQFRVIGSRNGRSMIGGFTLVLIDMKDGAALKIPSLLLDQPELENKLYEYPKVELNGIPWIRADVKEYRV